MSGTSVCRKCYYGLANRRQIAFVVDVVLLRLLVVLLAFLAGLTLAWVGANKPDEILNVVVAVLAYVLSPLLFLLKEGFAGTSPGKGLLGVRVVDAETLDPAGFKASMKRNLCLLIPIVPLVVAFQLGPGFRLGDRWTRLKTKVIWRKYAHHPRFTGKLSCMNCQYDLTGNVSGICPECGTPVPADDWDAAAPATVPIERA